MKPVSWILSLLMLSGCASTPQQALVPNWVHSPPKEGHVCQQAKGIYPLAEAEMLVIHQCLAQLADKRIIGTQKIHKRTTSATTNEHESVTIVSRSDQQFQVVNADQNERLSYELKGKYYDAVTEVVFVWIQLQNR